MDLIKFGSFANLVPRFDDSWKFCIGFKVNLKNLDDLNFKNSIIWNVQLFDLVWFKNVSLKFKIVPRASYKAS